MLSKKLNRVLLIDDDEATNFLHHMIIKSAGITDEIITKLNGLEALEYLTTTVDGKYPGPNLIFVDINMPKMNGWRFLEEYEKLPKEQKGCSCFMVVMLTTSLNPDDEIKAVEKNTINQFMSKPLTLEKLQKLLQNGFPENI